MSHQDTPRSPKRHDLVGRTFDDWTVKSKGKRRSTSGDVYWHCECRCGTQREIVGHALLKGNTKGCGCRSRERIGNAIRKHGWRKLPGYKRWRQMIRRCHSSNDSGYLNYGGRGIQVCHRWRESFAAFMEDMGSPPSPKHEIERIDNDGCYEPNNCRWATRAEQALNKRSNHLLTHNGVTLPIVCWAKKLKMGYLTLFNRLARGWTVVDAIETPVGAKRRAFVPCANCGIALQCVTNKRYCGPACRRIAKQKRR